MELAKILEKYFKEGLTDDAQKEINTLFETAVNEGINTKVEEAVAAKETELEEKNTTDLEAFKTDLVEKLNVFTKTAAKEFVEDYKGQIQESIKTDITEKAIASLKNVFTESNVVIPESDLDVVKSLEEKVDSANTLLKTEISEKLEAQKQCFEYEKVIKFNELTESLSDVKKEKVMNLIEGLMFNDIEDFEAKIKIVLEKVVDVKDEKKEELKESFDFDVDKYLP